MGRTRVFAWAAAATAALLVAGVALFTGTWVSRETREVVSDVALIPLAMAVAVLSFSAARRATVRDRVPWMLLALTGALWTLGELAWFWNRYLADQISDPSLADVFYLAAVVPAAMALTAFSVAEQGRSERLRRLLSALVVAASVLFVSRALALSVIFPAASGSVLERGVYLAYPIADIVLASLALVVFAGSPPAQRLQRGVLAGGFLLYSVADTAYSYLGALDRYQAGSLVDMGWGAGYALLALAALAPESTHRRADEGADGRSEMRSSSPYVLVMVYVPLLAAVITAAAEPEPLKDPVLVCAGITLLTCFGARQMLLSLDNIRLQGALHGRVAQLEKGRADLRRQVQQTERIVASVAEGVLGVDAEGRITFVNPPGQRLLMRSEAELLGAQHADLRAAHASASDDEHRSAVESVLSTGVGIGGERDDYLRGDGTSVPVELAVGPLIEDGVTSGAVVAFRDISEQRRVERMKDEFMSVVSHELRTPLTSIRGSLGLLSGGLGGELTGKGARLVDVALESSERLGRLIEDMLDFERIESSSSALTLREASAEWLVDTALASLGPLASQRGVHLESAGVGGRALVDPDRIIQTLINVIGNAIKFSPPDGAVQISAAPNGAHIEFAVRDQGPGIPAGQIDAIFERFHQVDSSDTRNRGGTGLGLAISKTIVEGHGGRIWADSRPGEGATFYFTVPAADHGEVREQSARAGS